MGGYTVYRSQLVKHLKIDEKTTPTRWAQQGVLVPYLNNASSGCLYTSTEVDAFLAREVHGFSVAPTFQDIVSGRVAIVTPVEAAELLGLTVEGVREVMLRGNINGFRLAHEYRYGLDSLKAYLLGRNDEQYLPRPVAQHVLGVSYKTIDRLVSEGLLTDASDTYRRRVTRKSLLALLRRPQFLPDWIDPQDWLEDRLDSKRLLLTTASILRIWGNRERLNALLDSGGIQFIFNPYGNIQVPRLVSPESWFAYIVRTEKPLTQHDMCTVFDVDRKAIRAWLKNNPEYFTCTDHDHEGQELYPTCLMGIVGRNLTAGINRTAIAWLEPIAIYGQHPLTVPKAAEVLRVSSEHVTTLLENDQLFGLQLPGGRWKVSLPSVIRRRSRDPKP